MKKHRLQIVRKGVGGRDHRRFPVFLQGVRLLKKDAIALFPPAKLFRFPALLAEGTDVNSSDQKRDPVFPAERLHRPFIPKAFFTAQAVVDMHRHNPAV